MLACSRLSVIVNDWNAGERRAGLRLSPARFFDRPHWPRAWNRLGKSWPSWRSRGVLSGQLPPEWFEMTPNKWINICSLSNTILSVEPNDPSETATWLIARPNAENARSPGTGLANVWRAYVVFTKWLILIWLTKASRWVVVSPITLSSPDYSYSRRKHSILPPSDSNFLHPATIVVGKVFRH